MVDQQPGRGRDRRPERRDRDARLRVPPQRVRDHQDGERRVADVEPRQGGRREADGQGAGGPEVHPPRVPETERQRERRRHLREHEAGVVDERRGQRERPAGRLGEPVAAGQLAHPLAHLERDERRQERHEHGDARVPGQGPRREDQDRQAHRVERVDLSVLPPHPEVRRERRVVEDRVAALGVVTLERHVPVAERLSATMR